MPQIEANPSERAVLCEFLDYQREALIRKLEGLSEEEARRTPTASSLSLLALVRHSAIWERRWFQVVVAGRTFAGEWPEVSAEESDETFRLSNDDTVGSVIAYYREQILQSQRVLDEANLDWMRRTSMDRVRWRTWSVIRASAGWRCT